MTNNLKKEGYESKSVSGFLHSLLKLYIFSFLLATCRYIIYPASAFQQARQNNRSVRSAPHSFLPQ